MTQAASTDSPRDALAALRIRRSEVHARPSLLKRMFRGLVVVLLLSGLVAGGYAFSVRQGWVSGASTLLTVPEAIRARPEVRTVTVSVERGRAADALVVATGYLESRRQARIGARAAGRIEQLNVEEGVRVKVGEVLGVLEHNDMDAALNAMRATAERARSEVAEQEIEISRLQRELARAERLHAARTITEAEYDTAKFNYEAAVARRNSLVAAVTLADARVQEAEQLLENMFIRAPFEGTVISRDAEVGESILPGGMGEASGRGSVVTIADLDHLEVDCDVKEDYINRVLPGQLAEVVVDAVPGERFQGRVRKIIPMGDRARATIKVKVEVLNADGRLFPEMSSTVYFLPAETSSATSAAAEDLPRVFCPENSVQRDAQGAWVLVLNAESRVARVAVTVGESRDGRTEILEGLQGGEQVLVNPPADIRDGMLVKTVR